MSDSPRPGSRPDPSDPYSNQPYRGYSDPAYGAGSQPGPGYSGGGVPPGPSHTEPLPQYWAQTNEPPGSAPYGNDQPPPEPPKGPRPWLLVAAGFAVVLVIGLVAWLLLMNSSSKQDTSIAASQSSSAPAASSSRAPTTTRSSSGGFPIPLPSITLPTGSESSSSNAPSGETEQVTYEVTGTGTALTITYNDTGGVVGNEMGVSLPWSKQINLAKPAKDSAYLTVSSGSKVTCKITIGGTVVSEASGSLLTTCRPSAG